MLVMQTWDDVYRSAPRRRRNGNGRHRDVRGRNHDPRPITGRNLAHTHRSASERAAIAAEMRLGNIALTKPTLRQVAALLNVSVPYVQAALDLDADARARVASGAVSLTDAAKANGLAKAYFEASPEVKIAAGRTIGPATLWDEVLVPNLT